MQIPALDILVGLNLSFCVFLMFLFRDLWQSKFRSPTCRIRVNGSWMAKCWISLSHSQTRYVWPTLFVANMKWADLPHPQWVLILLSPQVSVIKVKIHEATGMPAGKQKLQYEVSLYLLWCETIMGKATSQPLTDEVYPPFYRAFSSRIPTLWLITTWTMVQSFTWHWKREVDERSDPCHKRQKEFMCFQVIPDFSHVILCCIFYFDPIVCLRTCCTYF